MLRKALFIVLLLNLMISGAPIEADSGAKVLIVSNDNDINSSKLMATWLSEKGIYHETSRGLLPGFDFVIVLGGPKADITGYLARKYMPEMERILLMNYKGYWTFHVTVEGKSTLILIAGHTRKETLEATEGLIRSGTLEFMLSRESRFRVIYERGPHQGKDFEWKFPPLSEYGRKYSLSLKIPEILAEFYRVKPRMRLVEFEPEGDSAILTWYLMMRTPHDDEVLKGIADKLAEAASRDRIEGYDRIWFITSFVQHLRYSLAREHSELGEEYPKYPLETLVEGGGDCEDLTMLLISLLRESGFDSKLLVMPAHAAAAVAMPPEWVRFPRVKATVKDVGGGIKVALVDLLDLWRRRGEAPLTLEFRLGNKSYFYLESTWFFRPGELPDLLQLAEGIGWPYRDFPIWLVSEEGAPVPLIYDYLITSRRVSSGSLITVIVKVRNAGDREVRGLRLESQIYPGSKLETGGVEANLRRLAEFTGVRVTRGETVHSLDLGSIDPGEVVTYSLTFHTSSPTVNARVALYLGSSEVDFLRTRPFNP